MKAIKIRNLNQAHYSMKIEILQAFFTKNLKNMSGKLF